MNWIKIHKIETDRWFKGRRKIEIDENLFGRNEIDDDAASKYLYNNRANSVKVNLQIYICLRYWKVYYILNNCCATILKNK